MSSIRDKLKYLFYLPGHIFGPNTSMKTRRGRRGRSQRLCGATSTRCVIPAIDPLPLCHGDSPHSRPTVWPRFSNTEYIIKKGEYDRLYHKNKQLKAKHKQLKVHAARQTEQITDLKRKLSDATEPNVTIAYLQKLLACEQKVTATTNTVLNQLRRVCKALETHNATLKTHNATLTNERDAWKVSWRMLTQHPGSGEDE